jgi:plasmid stabilization system protein ParE
VARIFYGRRALADLERLFEFLAAEDPQMALEAVALVIDAITVLERHPSIGCPLPGNLRELVISHGRAGYVALYRLRREPAQIEVLAIRHQREAGFGA